MFTEWSETARVQRAAADDCAWASRHLKTTCNERQSTRDRGSMQIRLTVLGFICIKHWCCESSACHYATQGMIIAYEPTLGLCTCWNRVQSACKLTAAVVRSFGNLQL